MQSVVNMIRHLDSQESKVFSLESGPVVNPDGSEQQMNFGNDNFDVEFKIFTSNKDLDGTVLQNVEFDKWVSFSENTEVWYSSQNNLLPVLKKEIKKETPAFLFIVGIYSWQYTAKPLLFCKGVKKIISVRGMLHPGALSQKNFKKKIYLSLWKLLGLHKPTTLKLDRGTTTIFHATDEQEKEYIQQVFGKNTNVKVAANFPRVLLQQAVAEKKEGSLKLVSIGLISPMKNILLILETLKSLRPPPWRGRQAQGLEYTIYGPIKDIGYWEECEKLIKKMPANIIMKYNGDVQPKNIEAALAQNHVFILPSKSENFGHAIYEALTAGRPVITSNHTPWNNLKNSNAGINVATENTNELQSAIEYFAAMNQEQLTKWSDGAREYTLQAVDMNTTRKQYEEMFVDES